MNAEQEIKKLEEQLKLLKDKQASDRRTRIWASIDALTDGMCYEEMCEVRVCLNERIKEKYASDAIDDE